MRAPLSILLLAMGLGAGQAALASKDLSVSVTATPGSVVAGRDVMVTLTVTNIGTETAYTGMEATFPSTWQPVWAPGVDGYQPGRMVYQNYNYPIGGPPGSVTTRRFVVRPTPAAAGAAVTATLDLIGDFTPENNTVTATVDVAAQTAPDPVLRYRLYNDTTKEHLYTTDLNEYNTLGQHGWVQEGNVGKLLREPAVFNGVAAVPYYRIYIVGGQVHHWTTDPYEYYLLTVNYAPGYTAEGIDGFILPQPTAGATELFRMRYPASPNTSYPYRHWTIDPVEYTVLTSGNGWVGEPGSGYVIQ